MFTDFCPLREYVCLTDHHFAELLKELKAQDPCRLSPGPMETRVGAPVPSGLPGFPLPSPLSALRPPGARVLTSVCSASPWHPGPHLCPRCVPLAPGSSPLSALQPPGARVQHFSGPRCSQLWKQLALRSPHSSEGQTSGIMARMMCLVIA